MRRPWFPLVAVLVLAAAAVVGTLAAGNKPLLGLDLQGGISVVLQPKTETDGGVLNQAISIVRDRVDALGVAEPDITRQGQSIIVELPGIEDQERALQIVGQTAELRFRPVLQVLPPEQQLTATAAGTDDPLATTPDEQDTAEATVILPELDRDGDQVARYQLGPSEATGEIIGDARAQVDPQTGRWQVAFETTGRGRGVFADITTRLNGQRFAIVLDHIVRSAPTIQNPITNGDGVITGDFTQRQAKDLALVLRYGSLPVELEPATVRNVSATLGKDSLRAGVIAGVGGLALVAVYMLLYYRALGLVVILGLSVAGALMYSLISYLSASRGLALTLSGAVGIIVSVGVTVDSYIVYFERLKDEIRAGKTIRSSVDRGFNRAFRTILAGDTASFIGAALLYWLTVGAVRGFALFLMLSVLMDVVIAWCFTRPLVALLGRNRLFTEARWVGVARGLAARPAGGA